MKGEKLRGKFIVIEGGDGTGKGTQVALLQQRILQLGTPVVVYDFPKYESFYGREVGRRLKGDEGPLMDIDPFFMALLYANDRWQAQAEMVENLRRGYCLVANRFVSSNLAHGAAKYLSNDEALRFISLVERMEYVENGLPRPDIQFFLDVPSETARRMTIMKGEREYVGGLGMDLAESDINHQERAAMMFRWLCENRPNFVRVECCVVGNEILPREVIQEMIWGQLEKRGWV